MGLRKVFISGLTLLLAGCFISGWVYSQGIPAGKASKVDPELSALMLRNGKVVLSSAPQPETTLEPAPPGASAVPAKEPAPKELKGKAVSPGKKEKAYPAPEFKRPGAIDTPYPAPEIKKPAAPKKPAVTAPLPPIPPAKPAPADPATAPPAPAPSPDGLRL